MPTDIRNFFGSGPPASSSKGTAHDGNDAKSKKSQGRRHRIVDDSEDDDMPPKKSTPKKPHVSKKTTSSPQGKETSTSEFFGNQKPKRSQATNPAPTGSGGSTATQPSKPPPRNARTTRSTASESPLKNGTRGNRAPTRSSQVVDDDDGGDDIFAQDYKANARKKDDDYEESDDGFDDVDEAPPVRKSPRKTPKAKPEGDSDTVPNSSKQTAKGRKRKSADVANDDDSDDFVIENTPKKRKAKSAAKSPAKATPKTHKTDDVVEDPETKAILESIPTIRAPSPPPPSGEKFDYRAHAANTGPAPAAGSIELPQGAENCLAGLTFVFTGLLQSLERTEGQQLVKRYGGRVTGAPSKKTDYVVLGLEAGPKKLKIIRENNITTINEHGLCELIRLMPAHAKGLKGAAKYEEKVKAEAQKAQNEAAQMEKEERMAEQRKVKAETDAGARDGSKYTESTAEDRLWTVKYAPTQISQICGNKASVERLQNWLRNFPKNQRKGFKLPGKDGSGTFRAVIIHGPPGIGKTTAAHLVAKLEGYDIVESNASDTRSKKLVENGLKGVLSTTSLLGYFAGEGQKVQTSKKKLVLIMDEVDGMSAGDRGGVGALAAVCKKTDVPMILICNDRRQPKMKPFDYGLFDLAFRRPNVDQVRSRIMTIAYREGLKVPPTVINSLIEGSNSDIRQVVNMLSTARLDQDAVDASEGIGFDKAKQMSKAWEKNVILKPWDITSKILGGSLFTETSKYTLNDKAELYFNDFEFSPLMLQENYLNTNPIRARDCSGRKRILKVLELASQAADSISDGDLVDRQIHGSQQQWSLMPLHAMFSFVRPASFTAGAITGGIHFTSWLGKNSMKGRLSRSLKEIQGHMRLRCSGDQHEIRQQYVPLLWSYLVKKLEQEGKDAVAEVIEMMDAYYLTKDDFDAIQELGIGPMKGEDVKLDTQTKSTFTRLYNAQSHPLPFIKANTVTAPRKAAKEKPDLEEALEESDEGEVVEEAKDGDEAEGDLAKDKYVKQPKKRGASGGKTAAAGSKRAKKATDDDGQEEEPKPKRAKGAATGTKGKAKK